MAYPASLPSYAGFTSTHTLSQDGHASQENQQETDITAIATKVGTGASTPTSGVFLRGNGVGSSAWAAVTLSSADVSGVLPTTNGGSGNANLSFPSGAETVVGRAVSETLSNKTLLTPTIASFINAVHNHENSAGGGTLNAANAVQGGSVNYANLLSSIFSGQVLTQANAGTAGGTMSYINLGGIKLVWGFTASTGLANNTTASYTVTYPGSFFSTVTIATSSVASSGQANAAVYSNMSSTAATGTIVGTNVTGNSSNIVYNYFVIGT